MIKVIALGKFKGSNYVHDLVRTLRSRPACLMCIVVILLAITMSCLLKDENNIYDDGEIIVLSGVVTEVVESKNEYGDQTVISITDVRELKEGRLCKLTDMVDGNWAQKSMTLQRYVQLFIEGNEEVKPGSTVLVSGSVKNYKHARNYGEFDSYTYYHNRGYLFFLTDVIFITKSEKYSLLKDYLFTLKVKFSKTFDIYFDEIDASILKGMVLGTKKDINSEIKEAFVKNGIAHILAISGLHISFLCMGIYKLLTKTKLPVMACVIISEILLVLYIIMVGFSPSAFRAGFMFTMFLISKQTKRAYDLLSAMSVSLIIILSFNFCYIYDSACQLSYAAIVAVGFFYPSFCRNIIDIRKIRLLKYENSRIACVVNYFIRGLLSSLFVSIMVFLVALPITLNCYYEIAFYSVILNLVVIPLMSVLLGCAILVLFASLINTHVAGLFAFICKAILWIYKSVCFKLEENGFGRINLGKPGVVAVLAYYAVLIIICLYNGKYRKTVFMAGICLCAFIISYKPVYDARMYMLDVDQGDGIVFINDNSNVYIFDGGSTGKKRIGERVMIPFLKAKGVKYIEGIFISHPDKDHTSGIEEILQKCKQECIKVNNIYVYEGFLAKNDYESIVELAKSCNASIIGIDSSFELHDAKLKIRCIYPKPGLYNENVNNSSLVMMLNYNNFTVLETGDLEAAGEEILVNQYGKMHVDVLKVSHHGSSTGTTEAFLENTAPKLALISAGIDNSYGHPHKETLENLKNAKVNVLRTDERGQITVIFGKNSVKVSCYK